MLFCTLVVTQKTGIHFSCFLHVPSQADVFTVLFMEHRTQKTESYIYVKLLPRKTSVLNLANVILCPMNSVL